MKSGVEQALHALREAFPQAALAVEEDGAGGAYVLIEPIDLGAHFIPDRTWIGGHLPPQLPYADVYPLFVGADVTRADKVPFSPPVTAGHRFRGRPALQISRRTNRLDPEIQSAAMKFQKVLHWFRSMS